MSYYTDKQYKIIDYSNKSTYAIFFQFLFAGVKGKILDVGCSVGNYISLAPKRIVGVDIDKKALRIAKKRGFEVYGYN